MEYCQSVKAYLAKKLKLKLKKLLCYRIWYFVLWFIDFINTRFNIFSNIGLLLTGIYPTIIMIEVSSNNTVEEMSRISIPTVHTFIQQELRDAHNLIEAEVYQL
ncbi:hypothetical protein HETIRDRAFT_168792 [Heterobasidion irregulare TC 32-1]|uniref:Uncharacterized protein n=1 Tax=Heterobasidion irregulare (strain TC 32-1) TaxID=747525 RepID=W4K8U9_HETIT|nr:uncharacterized protein HETIRDRAFT_168792 [Heterobasidion irregulare TC 32-1]ETW82262.1 hypothetical protein HETIRDRAFT_168792 [Heterobasidion irregulare TC 32-1]